MTVATEQEPVRGRVQPRGDDAGRNQGDHTTKLKTAKAAGSPRRGAGVAAATTKIRLTGVIKPAKKKPGNLFKGAYKVKDRYASVPRAPVDPLGAL